MSGTLSRDKHEQGLQHFRDGQVEVALQLLGEAIAEGETSERWNDWAAVQLAAHNVADAEKAFRRALKLEPENFEAAANLGAVLASLGRSDEAIPLLERSQKGLATGERAMVAQILAQCRAKSASSVLANGKEEEGPSPLLTKLISMQTTALNSIAIRLIAVEEALDRLTRLLEDTQSPDAKRREKEIIPKIRATDVVCEGIELNVLALDGNIENVSVVELKLILHLLRASKARTAFEFGTADGRTTLNLAANSPEDARIYTLDIERERLGARFRGSEFERKITQLSGETSDFDFSPYFNLMDFIFIDAGHDYEHVRNDSFTALRLLRGGKGTIVWHDYSPSWNGVYEALHELYLTEPKLAGMRHIKGTALVYVLAGEKGC
ncbi:MAG: class I SAM-dependent methyltransferase [Candidatus Acidiferrales bacterium]